MLDILLSWIRDCILFKSGVAAEQLVHHKRLRDLENFTQKRSFENLEDIKEDIVKAYYLLKENLNMKIPLLLIKEKL